MAKRGFFPALRVAGSVFGFIRIRGVGLIGHRFVQDRLRDGVALGCPVAQVEQAAALAAEGKIGMGVGISGFLADGAVPFHVRPPRELHAPEPPCVWRRLWQRGNPGLKMRASTRRYPMRSRASVHTTS